MAGNWPYANGSGSIRQLSAEVLVLGGGLAGCHAAIAAARAGRRTVLVEKGGIARSGSAGTGFDHWEMACTNPGCRISPEEMTAAIACEQDGYSNVIGHYIETREGYDRLLDLEKMGGKIRDSAGEFEGAAFRDPGTGFLYAYDYENRYTLRVWGTTFKPALARELRRLGVTVLERTEALELLTAEGAGRKRCTGAVCMNVRTGEALVISAPATVLCMSRPARIWLFHADTPGLSEFRPFQSVGAGHAMAWRAGAAMTMMEKSVRAEFSASGRSYPPYGTGNNHNTWYAATMVDSRGVEIPYVDRDGRELKTVDERYRPAPGQKFFLKGGIIDEAKYAWRGPETLPFDELMRRGYRLPFYADLSRMPEEERRAIWGLMVGEEGKTRVPVRQLYEQRGFDPARFALQSYGTGWQSAAFLDQERQLFGAPGGLMHDWNLQTSVQGLYAAGDQLFASDCAGFACATGAYAGRRAAAFSAGRKAESPDMAKAEKRCREAWAPLSVQDGLDWREVNMACAKTMQLYCGGMKCDALLRQGLEQVRELRDEEMPRVQARNPHELMRVHEVADILEVCGIIYAACLNRKASSEPLQFRRSDSLETEKEKETGFLTVWQEAGEVRTGFVPHDYAGDVAEAYARAAEEERKVLG